MNKREKTGSGLVQNRADGGGKEDLQWKSRRKSSGKTRDRKARLREWRGGPGYGCGTVTDGCRDA